jgi:REP-associated tyrosine transposase
MGRPRRIEYPGAVHHVVSRSNAGEEIFRHDRDAAVFCATLARAIRDHRWRCHAYCVMPTHYHLLLETPQATLSTGMHRLNASYARLFNAAAERRGHVFQKRFHSELIARDEHLMEALRYIVLNPVRARLVDDPAAWTWSSYRSTAGLEPAPRWVTTEDALRLFGPRPEDARLAYRVFVREGDRTPRVRETQAEMARRLGVSQATVSRMLRERRE